MVFSGLCFKPSPALQASWFHLAPRCPYLGSTGTCAHRLPQVNCFSLGLASPRSQPSIGTAPVASLCSFVGIAFPTRSTPHRTVTYTKLGAELIYSSTAIFWLELFASLLEVLHWHRSSSHCPAGFVFALHSLF